MEEAKGDVENECLLTRLYFGPAYSKLSTQHISYGQTQVVCLDLYDRHIDTSGAHQLGIIYP